MHQEDLVSRTFGDEQINTELIKISRAINTFDESARKACCFNKWLVRGLSIFYPPYWKKNMLALEGSVVHKMDC